ncbi:MAG: hypothetical protein ACO3GX_11730, partial [Gemmataceae bacterium]
PIGCACQRREPAHRIIGESHLRCFRIRRGHHHRLQPLIPPGSIYRSAQTVQQSGAVPLVVIKAVQLNLGYADTPSIVHIGHPVGKIILILIPRHPIGDGDFPPGIIVPVHDGLDRVAKAIDPEVLRDQAEIVVGARGDTAQGVRFGNEVPRQIILEAAGSLAVGDAGNLMQAVVSVNYGQVIFTSGIASGKADQLAPVVELRFLDPHQ